MQTLGLVRILNPSHHQHMTVPTNSFPWQHLTFELLLLQSVTGPEPGNTFISALVMNIQSHRIYFTVSSGYYHIQSFNFNIREIKQSVVLAIF